VNRLRRYLVAGLLIWVPLGVTALVVKLVVDLMDRTLLLIPAPYRPENLLGMRIPGLGIAISIVVVLATGMVVANLFGRRLVRTWEDVLARIPLVRSIYSAVKQIVETVFSDTGRSFRKVALIEYPRRGVWTLCFVTGDGVPAIEAGAGCALVNVFVPTTPNPTSGFFLMLPREDVHELDLPVETGLKMIISAGVFQPSEREIGVVPHRLSRERTSAAGGSELPGREKR
jgi:uncharacterized membrane protein